MPLEVGTPPTPTGFALPPEPIEPPPMKSEIGVVEVVGVEVVNQRVHRPIPHELAEALAFE
ncbi:MAG: hypothetical protein R2853_20400 [Thermomicrobiales bacterium]